MTWLALVVLSTASPVTLELDPCLGDVQALERQTRLELAEVKPVSSGLPLTVRGWCAQGLVELEVREGATVRARRQLDTLTAPGPASLRLVALTIAELVSAAPPARTPLGVPPPAVEPQPAPDLEPPADKLWALWLQGGGFAAFGAQPQLGLGGRVGVQRKWSLFSVRAELALEHTSERDPLGWLDELLMSGSAGGQVHPWSTLPVAFGVSMKFGVARLTGQPDQGAVADGATKTGPFVSVFAHAKARVAPVDRAGFVVGLELGVVLLPYRGAGSDGQLWGCEGAWVALNVGWELPW